MRRKSENTSALSELPIRIRTSAENTPVALASVLYDVLNSIAVDAVLSHAKAYEVDLAREHLDFVEENDLLNEFIYVADMYNHRIQKFKSDGSFVQAWGSIGSAEGQLDEPADIAIDSNGNIYVIERYNHRVQIFTPDGMTHRCVQTLLIEP
ncbi:MAG: hypothetical protein GY795_10040 [Desulfobacterales bacterium]|nr:hypothetical protein [Desulfobacterales bacterium]